MSTEVVRLRRTVRRLEAESEIARRLARFDDSGPKRCRIYRFIAKESDNFATAALCRVCGVSTSAYYAWSKKGEAPTEVLIEEAYLANCIYDTWTKSRRRYGVPRVTAALWKQGEDVSEKKVARLMGELSIAGISGRRKVRTTRRDPNHELATDLVERDFTADLPDELWLTDVTYIATDEGWLYLCSIFDVFSRRFVGWSLQDHLRTELCLDALDAAAMVRGKHCFFGTTLHSDHGCQYTADSFKKRCEQLGIVQSMGTVGDSYDNSMMESAWASLKRELVYETHFTTREEARRAVFEWIVWYNSERLHSSIDYMSPMEFEGFWINQEAA